MPSAEDSSSSSVSATTATTMTSTGTTTTGKYVIEVVHQDQPAVLHQDQKMMLTRDVDLLVSQIKENLRLSGLKAKSSLSHRSRPSPYRIPSRSWADMSSCEACQQFLSGCTSERNNCDRHHNNNHNHHQLHHKKRIHVADDDPYELLQELLREGGLIKEAVKRLRTGLEDLKDEIKFDDECEYTRKPYYYDSEDEPLPQVFQPLEL